MDRVNPGTIRINMKSYRAKIGSNFTAEFAGLNDMICQNNGIILTLNASPYMEWLNDRGVFYTFEPLEKK